MGLPHGTHGVRKHPDHIQEEVTGLMAENMESHNSSANSVTSHNRSRCTIASEVDKSSLASPDSNHGHSYQTHHTSDKAVFTALMALIENTSKDQSYYWLVKEWRIIAMILDRVFFLIYVISIVISLILLFPRPNYD